MCGIVGVINGHQSMGSLMAGLKQLEYRGYDSAGVAVIDEVGLKFRKATGKLINLSNLLETDPVDGRVGIAHTRWATHGAPNEINAHPHVVGDVAVVHNGIIENYRDLRARLEADGHEFSSETDTEVIPHLVHHFMEAGASAECAVQRTIDQLSGAYALGILVQGETDRMFAARCGSPLAVGYADDAMMIASDGQALAPLTDRVSYIEDGDIAILERNNVEVLDQTGRSVSHPIINTGLAAADVGKGGYRHYMLKEIHEQPDVVRRTLGEYLDPKSNQLRSSELPFDFETLPRLAIVACGTSAYAGQVAKYWFEEVARIPVDVDIASEYRYRNSPPAAGGATLFISQSGETADTLAALRHARDAGQHIISLVNVPQSTMARESDVVFQTHAGPEIGVASTKAFMAQLTSLSLLTLHAALARGTISGQEYLRLIDVLKDMPELIERILLTEDKIDIAAREICNASSALFLGRGISYPIAMEGALKLKEISYIHAEGFGAGELKHGPIALIDEETPVVAMASMGKLFEKSVSNLEEVAARGAKILAISQAQGLMALGDTIETGVEIPSADAFIDPFLEVVPLQLLAYMVAIRKGTDVDQPRNLAKSVTVE